MRGRSFFSFIHIVLLLLLVVVVAVAAAAAAAVVVAVVTFTQRIYKYISETMFPGCIIFRLFRIYSLC